MKDRRRIICTNLGTRNLFTDETGTYRRLIIEEGMMRLRSYDWSYAFDKSHKWDFPGKFDTWINLDTEELVVVEEVGCQHTVSKFLELLPKDTPLLFHSSEAGSWVFRKSDLTPKGSHSWFVELEDGIFLDFHRDNLVLIRELRNPWKDSVLDYRIDPEITYFKGKNFTELVEITEEEYERFKGTGQI